jgi:hypothetical protein
MGQALMRIVAARRDTTPVPFRNNLSRRLATQRAEA